MKFLCASVLASLFAAASAQFAITQPKPGAIIQPGQNLNIQILVPISTSPMAGREEISLAIGIVNCGNALCPTPASDLGEFVFIGKFVSQGQAPGSALNLFQNFSVKVPNDISGRAAVQVQRNSAATPPGHSIPMVEYLSIPVQATGSPVTGLNVHPNGDNSKCVGILGGVYGNGSAVDIYDCNGSATQKWIFNGGALQSTNPADGSKWCLDSSLKPAWADGLKMKIWQCFANLQQQTWTPVNFGTFGSIKLTSANFCLDLTDGVKKNRNVLQIWTCAVGNTNQIWSVTAAAAAAASKPVASMEFEGGGGARFCAQSA